MSPAKGDPASDEPIWPEDSSVPDQGVNRQPKAFVFFEEFLTIRVKQSK
jgi:hypothetical protein